MSLSSVEVAADFKDALQDLKLNSRPEISNLTIIAKENTEHAQAISHELENHIQTTRPEWKLPSLYVLDSIVKNVGTPYTVYLGRNLYRTFMNAYLAMSEGMRKAMEGLLRTWKQPVPESMDPRPVFPPEVTGDIENALNKMRSAIQQAPVNRPMHALPPRPATNVAWRNNTSTPPQHGNMYAAPQDPRVQQTFQSGPQCGNFPAGQAPYGTPQSFPSLMSSNDLEDLKTEVGKLIANSQQAFAYNPADTSLQTKLQALLQLKKVLDTQTLPPQQLEAVRMQVRNLAPPPAPTPMPTFAPPVSFPPPMIHSPHPTPTPSFPPPASTPQLNLAQLLANMRPPAPQVTTAPPPSTPNLADLLRHVSSAQSSTPPVAAFFPPSYPNPSTFSTPVQAPAVPASAPSAPPNLAQILAQFSKPAGAPSVPAMQHAQPPMNHMTQFQSQPPAGLPMQGSADWLLNALKGFPNPGTPSNSTPLPSQPMTRQISAPKNAPNEIELTTASMKMPRFHLISQLYEAYPNLCSTCGRRFAATAEGRQKKARHMDWHFKAKDPDAAKRGVHRSWYISEKDWTEYQEMDDTSPEQAGSGSFTAAVKKQAKDRYVHAPQDASTQRPLCSICQEKLSWQWHPEANDFVFMDALQLGEKYYHATCFEDFSKATGTAMPTTPEPVLGKRKAEADAPLSGKKVRAY